MTATVKVAVKVSQCWLFCLIALGQPLHTLAQSKPDPAQLAQDYRTEALQLRQAERFTEAIALLKQATSLAPNHSNGWVLLGWTQHLNGERQESAQSLWQAIFLEPTNPEAYNGLGIVYLVKEELPVAIALHSWATLLKPDNKIAYYNLSLAYQRQQLPDLAIAYGTAATKLEPNNPHPYLALSLAHANLDQPEHREQARRFLTIGLELNPQYREPSYLANLSRAGFNDAQIAQIRSMLKLIDG